MRSRHPNGYPEIDNIIDGATDEQRRSRRELAADHGVTKADAKKIVDGVFAAIGDAAARGDEISINAFGKFKVKDSPERDGRNPSTGEKITIKASKKLTFQPAKAVRDKLLG